MVKILDSTLREGEQTPGVAFPGHAKLKIATLLDAVGVDIIEAGHPIVSEEICEAVGTLAGHEFQRAIVGAHARSLREDVDTALRCGVEFIGLFYCVSRERLDDVFKNDLDGAIDQITRIIEYAKSKDPSVTIRYTPEDTVRSDFDNVCRAAVAASRAGAEVISIADTTGYMIPGTSRSMYEYVLRLREALNEEGESPQLAVHCHNDRGLAVANAVDAFRAGIDIIDTCVLGLGERTGIADLATLLAVLSVDFGQGDWDLSRIGELYEFVSRASNTRIPPGAPVVGENAFTHCAGLHTQAASRNPRHYESIPPEIFGRTSFVSLDQMSGSSSVRARLLRIGISDPRPELIDRVLGRVKEIGQRGRTVDDRELEQIVRYFDSSRKKAS